MDENQSLSETNTQPWIFFRLAEFYLNYAEAEFYLGNEEECRNAINRVRNRESVKMPAVIESGDQLLEKLRNERRIELVFENHRYFDLRRWRIAEVYENIDAKGIEVVKKDDGTFSYNPITVLERKFLPQHYLLPIPRSEIIKSNNSLMQNPYYN